MSLGTTQQPHHHCMCTLWGESCLHNNPIPVPVCAHECINMYFFCMCARVCVCVCVCVYICAHIYNQHSTKGTTPGVLRDGLWSPGLRDGLWSTKSLAWLSSPRSSFNTRGILPVPVRILFRALCTLLVFIDILDCFPKPRGGGRGGGGGSQ